MTDKSVFSSVNSAARSAKNRTDYFKRIEIRLCTLIYQKICLSQKKMFEYYD